jgi:hypothetical protein
MPISTLDLYNDVCTLLASACEEDILKGGAQHAWRLVRLTTWPDQPEDEVSPSFVRFDLNKPGHDNAVVGERCHMHVGSDRYSAPAPLMTPLDILDLFIHGLRPSNVALP